MAVNRFMKPIQGPRNQQYMELDYNQLAAGVLAREDAYDTNAAEIDILDQDYIQGITGVESDRAKEINSNIEGMVGSIGDQYNGDLSKSSDAIRRAKKYIRKTTGNDSEGALINANLKAYQANVKEIDKQENWSEEYKNLMRNKALQDHQGRTSASREESGNFSNYSDYEANAFVNVPEKALEYAKEMKPQEFQSAMNLAGIQGSVTQDGHGQYHIFSGGKSIRLTDEQIINAVTPMLTANPEVMAYENTKAELDIYRNNITNPNRYEQAMQINTEFQNELELLQEGTTTKKGIVELQQWLNDKGSNITVDGIIGEQTKTAIAGVASALSEDFNEDTEKQQIINNDLGVASNAAAGLKTRNDFYNKTMIKANADYKLAQKARQKKLDALEVSTGNVTADPTTNKYSETQETMRVYNEELKQKTSDINLNFKTKFKTEEEVNGFVSELLNLTVEQKLEKYNVKDQAELNKNQDYINDNNLITSFNSTYTSKNILENQNKVNIPETDKKQITNTVDKFYDKYSKLSGLGNSPASTPENNPNHITTSDEVKVKEIAIRISSKNGTSKDFIREIAMDETLKKKYKIGSIDDYGDGFMAGVAEGITEITNGKVNPLKEFYTSFNKNIPKEVKTKFKDGSYIKTVKAISFEEKSGSGANYNKNLLGDVFRFNTESVAGSTKPFIDVLEENDLSKEDVVSNTSNVINGKIVNYINTEKDGKTNQFIRYSDKDQTSRYTEEVNNIMDNPSTTPEDKNVAAVTKLNINTKNYFLNKASEKLDNRKEYDKQQRIQKTNEVPPPNYEYKIGDIYTVEYEVDDKYTDQVFRIKAKNNQTGESDYIDFTSYGITNSNHFNDPADAEIALGKYLRKLEQ